MMSSTKSGIDIRLLLFTMVDVIYRQLCITNNMDNIVNKSFTSKEDEE